MGLHSPFGYVNYEIPLAELFADCLDKLCAHCHTNEDYNAGCHGCPAGQLIYACREYILSAGESDKRFELYASDEWAGKQKQIYGKENPPELRQKDREMAQDYKPECEILRAIKAKIRKITPHPFFYVRGKGRHRRPKALKDFKVLVAEYRRLYNERLGKWGLPQLISSSEDG